MDGRATQELSTALKRRFPFAAILLLESAPQESFTDANENLSHLLPHLPG